MTNIKYSAGYSTVALYPNGYINATLTLGIAEMFEAATLTYHCYAYDAPRIHNRLFAFVIQCKKNIAQQFTLGYILIK